jgi:ABC-type transport system substrate-binding protein
LRTGSAGVGLLAGALLLGACAAPVAPAAPAPARQAPPEIASTAPAAREPTGTVRVAVPEAPTSWLPLDGAAPVQGDLAALWGLPLYHLDAAGQPRPALVESASVDASGREVRLVLKEGSWSDGEPVTAHDLAATVEALREEGEPVAMAVEEVSVADDREARMVLDAPTRTWPGLLGRMGVLPAHVLADGGLEAADSLSVTGGPFRLVEHQAGLVSRFVAHPDGPLGTPALEAIDAVVVPSFDTALGLLHEGEVDAIIGHLALRVPQRVAALDDGPDLSVTAPVGGTTVALRWHPDGALDVGDRRGVAATVRLLQQVDGLDLGTPVTTPVPGMPIPASADDPTPVDGDVGDLDASLSLQAEQEMLSLTANLVEAQVRGGDGRLRVERLSSPEDVRRSGEYDGRLAVRRDDPWTPLASWYRGTPPDTLQAGDGAPSLTDDAATAALQLLDEQAWETPLYRPRVAHVWRADLHGVAPSSWPGAGFTSAARWRWEESS